MERDCDNSSMVAPLIDGNELPPIASRRSSTSSSASREQHSTNESNRDEDEAIAACRDVFSSNVFLINYSTQTDDIQLDSQSQASRENYNNSPHSVPISIGESSTFQEIHSLKSRTVESDHPDEENCVHEDSMKFDSKSNHECTGNSSTRIQEMKSLSVLVAHAEDRRPSISIREMRRSKSNAGFETEKESYSAFRRYNSNILSTRKRKFSRRTSHLGGIELLKPRCDLENETTDDIAQTHDKHDQIELSSGNLNLTDTQCLPQNNYDSRVDYFNHTPSGSNYQSQLSFESQFSDDSLTAQRPVVTCAAIVAERYSVTAKKADNDPISATQIKTVTPSRGRLVIIPLKNDSLQLQNPSYSNLASFEETHPREVTDLPDLPATNTIGSFESHKESISSSDSPPPLPDCSPPIFLGGQQKFRCIPHTNTSQSHDELESQDKIIFQSVYSNELPLTPSINEALHITHTEPITSLSSIENSDRQYPSNFLGRVSSEESEEKTFIVGSYEKINVLESLKIKSSTDSFSTTSSEECLCEISSTDLLSDKSSAESLNFIAHEFPGLAQSSKNSMTTDLKYYLTTSSVIEFPNANTNQTVPLSAKNEDSASIHSGGSRSIKSVLLDIGVTEQISPEFPSTISVPPVDIEILKNVTALSPDSDFNVSSTESVRKSQFNVTTPVNTFYVDAVPSERAEKNNASLKNRRDHAHHLRLTLNCANDNRISPDQTIDVPPPIPPKSASFGKNDASQRFPFHVSAERRGSSWNMDDRKSPQDCPPDLPPKRPYSYHNRRCCSTLIDTISITRNAVLRRNTTEATVTVQVHSTGSSPVLSKVCDASVVEMDIPPSLIEKNLTVAPPPRPPSMYRSFSHNEESMEKSALYILSSESGVKSEPTTIGKKYGESLKSSAFIEARNIHVQTYKFSELFASSFTKLDIETEARLQHFPVKLDSTHHRLSVVSPGWANVTSPASGSKINTFRFPDCGVNNRMNEDDDYQETQFSSDQADQQDSALCLQLDNSEAINERMFLWDSQTESDKFSSRESKHLTTTRLSTRFSREIQMYQRGDSIRQKKLITQSSADLLQDECEMGFDSRFDISEVGITGVSAQPTMKTSKSKISLPHISKVSLQVVSDNLKLHFGKISASNYPTAKEKKSEEAEQFRRSHSERLLRKEREKVNAPRNKNVSLGVPAFLRFSMTRDPSTVRGVPSDLNPLMDSAIQATEEERHNISLDSATDNMISSSDRGRKPGRWDRPNSYSVPDSLRFSNHHDPRSSKSSGENTDSSMSDNFSIVSFVSDQIDGRPEENLLAPLILRQDSRINSTDNSEWNVEGMNHSIKGLMRDMERYTEVLIDLHETYSIMRSKTPDGIRQRFDLAFKEIQLMLQLQNELNSVVAESENDFGSIAEVFKKTEFSVYKRYTVLANNIQKDMKSYAAYFRENFTDLATKIMVPSTRLNVYAQHLRGFLNHFCSDSRHSLQKAITYLETLKDQANTEMTINVIQNCPVELRLVGLIRHVGEMHYEGDSLSRKLYYLILFDSILIITENKYDFCTYKQHIRSEQLIEVQEHGLSRIIFKVCPSYLNDVVTYKFRTVTNRDRNVWISILKNWQDTNQPSYNNTVIHQDLISQLNPKPDRFWPLSLWLISPRLEEAINVVKHQEMSKSPPRRSNVDIFNEFVKLEEDFVDKLNIFLDPESMPPPAILGSALRKIRRFHKAQFLPKLKKAYANEPSSILDCIIGNLPNLPCLYKEFIEVRAGLTLTMIDGDHVRLYISPFQHLAAYIEWIYEVSCMPRYHSHLRGQLNILLNCVEDARVSLLHIAIPNCRMDYYKAGDILHRGTLESKVKSKNVKSNQNYYVILFEKVLMFTRLRMPSYEFVQAVWLDQLTLGPPAECKRTFKVEERLQKKELVYELRAESVMQRNLWVEKVAGVLNKLALAIKKNVSAGRV